MITFNSKIVTFAAVVLLAYFAYMNQKESFPVNKAMQKDFQKAIGADPAATALYKIQVPKNKRYENYNPLEKFIYHFSKDKNQE